MRRRGLVATAVALAAVLGLGTAGVAAPPGSGVSLGPLLRVTSPAGTPDLCPAESEPEVTHTSAGTWVAYNDTAGCGFGFGTPARDDLRLTGVQLLPAAGGPPRVIALPPPQFRTGSYAGDPDLAPDPKGDGGVLLATILEEHDSVRADYGLHVAVVRIPVRGPATLLPSPSTGSGDDKEFLATDTSVRSPFRGRTYLVWQDFATMRVTVRAFDGRRWLAPILLGAVPASPDVAVSPTGDVAVVFVKDEGVSAAVSRDGGASFLPTQQVLRGQFPGRYDAECNSRSTVGLRQRASSSPHVAWDRRGHLHVVAALGTGRSQGTAVGGDGRILHTESADRGGHYTAAMPVGTVETDEVQWAPALAALPDGGVAVSYLQTSQPSSYEALVALRPEGRLRFRSPIRLSTAPAEQPKLTEANGNGFCYGLGDYIGLSPTSDGVVAVWPTTSGTRQAFVDTDIAARAVHVAR